MNVSFDDVDDEDALDVGDFARGINSPNSLVQKGFS